MSPTLYIFWFLHQTTTWLMNIMISGLLYIFWFLHQTTTSNVLLVIDVRCISFDSYIKPQQQLRTQRLRRSCISFDSYIKPQQFVAVCMLHLVVYLLIPTSNHNCTRILPFGGRCISFDSYIKPQQIINITERRISCISFDSYIKPQLQP